MQRLWSYSSARTQKNVAGQVAMDSRCGWNLSKNTSTSQTRSSAPWGPSWSNSEWNLAKTPMRFSLWWPDTEQTPCEWTSPSPIGLSRTPSSMASPESMARSSSAFTVIPLSIWMKWSRQCKTSTAMKFCLETRTSLDVMIAVKANGHKGQGNNDNCMGETDRQENSRNKITCYRCEDKGQSECKGLGLYSPWNALVDCTSIVARCVQPLREEGSRVYIPKR